MTDYTLYYWPLPFRGAFIRAVLAHAGADWTEAGVDETARVKDLSVDAQPVPAMAPPVLTDHGADATLAQMGAILLYLGDRFGLMPGDAVRDALTAKLVADANDVLDEITRYGGRMMWDRADWEAFRPRLARWMAIFEETGQRHGLTEEGGTMLGTDAPGLADLVACVLWGTMTDKLPALRPMLDAHAPAVAALSDRLGETPALAELRAATEADYGDLYCGGQIERSIRAMLA
ncbi:glutathione S-transferase [Psychromarinibacter sp. C21-152]|uniref:Glutathione S-transferase n=1 Tax=Psychromarinibacter sediminicola TaxID=3033385 RepID=A0AAE3NTJ7_9RHOB|nr:glutathione S-transferase [Psychromarinibacter sediminicola]MDF0601756.1 glutathione S-transferase [Psychromarinibacter sediminicola]